MTDQSPTAAFTASSFLDGADADRLATPDAGAVVAQNNPAWFRNVLFKAKES